MYRHMSFMLIPRKFFYSCPHFRIIYALNLKPMVFIAAEQHSQSSNRSTGSAPLRASHALQHSGSPTAMAAAAIMTSKTPPIKRPLSTSNVGPNVGLPSYYAGGSVFSPLESGYASSMNDLYS